MLSQQMEQMEQQLLMRMVTGVIPQKRTSMDLTALTLLLLMMMVILRLRRLPSLSIQQMMLQLLQVIPQELVMKMLKIQ